MILVEEAASGVQLAQQLRENDIRSVKAVKPEGDKVMRMHASSPVIENGFVWAPRKAHWLDAYLHELTTFPASKRSDQVDSTSQALAWMGTRAAVDPEALQWRCMTRLSLWSAWPRSGGGSLTKRFCESDRSGVHQRPSMRGSLL